MAIRLLLLGASGQVGQSLKPLLSAYEVIAPARCEADLSKPEYLESIIWDIQPQVIINAAAYTTVDKAELERELAFKVNFQAPEALAHAALRCGSLLIHYSTDYVFDGIRNKSEPGYREIDQTAPLGVYGASKLAGELAIHESGCNHIIFRTAWVYSAFGTNFVSTIRRLVTQREILRVVEDQIGTPTWAGDIASATLHALQKHSFNLKNIACQQRGLFHLTAGGRTSWHNFAELILGAEKSRGRASATTKIEPISTAEYPTLVQRPAFSVLDSSRFFDNYGFVLSDWESRFREFLASEDEK